MPARDVSPEILYEVHRRLDAAPHRQKTPVVKEIAAFFGVSTATVYRWDRDRFGHKKQCAGRPQLYSEALIEAVVDEIARGMEMGTSRRRIKTETVLKRLASYEGFPYAAEAARASAGNVNSRIKAGGYFATPFFNRIEPDYAGQISHLDFSRSKYFQIHTYDAGRDDYILRVEGHHLAYKENNKTRKSWLVLMVEGYSRMFKARMYPASGEDAMLALGAMRDFLVEPDGDHPLRYGMEQLWMDRGAAAKTEYFRNALSSNGIELVEVQSKEANGKVERRFRSLWAGFELPLALDVGRGGTITMSEYNEALAAHALHVANSPHVFRAGSQAEVYAASLDARGIAHVFDEDLALHAFDVQVRTVGPDGCVSLAGYGIYRLPTQVGGTWVQAGMKVRLHPYPKTGEVVGRMVDVPHDGHFALERVAAYGPTDWEGRAHGTPADRVKNAAASSTRTPSREHHTPAPAWQRPAAAPQIEATPARPRGPREDVAVPTVEVLSPLAIRDLVGQHVARFGVTFADVEPAFSDLLDRLPTRAEVEARIEQAVTLLTTARRAA